jgi:mRNA interferase MazF
MLIWQGLMPNIPKRGEIWLVNLDPTVGSEIRKTRPVVVLSSDFIGRLPIKFVVPITEWKPAFAGDFWHIQLEPSAQNSLTKASAADALQARSLDIQRFVRLMGQVSSADLQEITLAIVTIIEHQADGEL